MGIIRLQFMSHMIELVRETLLQKVDSHNFAGVTTHTGIDMHRHYLKPLNSNEVYRKLLLRNIQSMWNGLQRFIML